MASTLKILTFVVAATAAAGCHLIPDRKPALPAKSTAAFALGDEGSGHLRNLAEFSFVADPGKARVVISAPPGSFVAGAAGLPLTVWEIAPAALVNQYVVEPGRVRVPGELRGTVQPAADGSFAADVDYHGRGALVLATDADVDASVLFLREGVADAAAYKNPLDDEAAPSPLAFADFSTPLESQSDTSTP